MDTIFNNPITEIIKARHSVRNYENRPLSNDLVQKIEKYIDNLDNPFNKNIKVKLLKKDTPDKEFKLGTYGVIKGASYYLAVACKKEDFCFEALGYTFEKVVLYCTSLGLGTVWLGGTFNKGEFAKAMNLSDDEILPIVSPVGYEGGKKSMIATLIGNNNSKRKKYSELFFDNSFNNPLSKNLSKEYIGALEMVRVAPSSVNKQPWRVVKINNDFHFYNVSKRDMNKIDIGIALCHFHLTLLESGINKKFEFKNPKIDTNYDYVISLVD